MDSPTPKRERDEDGVQEDKDRYKPMPRGGSRGGSRGGHTTAPPPVNHTKDANNGRGQGDELNPFVLPRGARGGRGSVRGGFHAASLAPPIDLDLAKNGDLILTVGSEKKRVRVYSQILTNSMPKLMMNRPGNIIQSDCSAAPLIDIFRYLHNPSIFIASSEMPAPDSLYRITNLLKVYACEANLKALIYSVLLEYSKRPAPSTFDRWMLLAAAYNSDLPDMFWHFTDTLINAKGSYRRFADFTPVLEMRKDIAWALEENRAHKMCLAPNNRPLRYGLCLFCLSSKTNTFVAHKDGTYCANRAENTE